MTDKEIEKAAEECLFYKQGKCVYFCDVPNDYFVPLRRCCMRIVKPMTECFYYQPKEKKDNES